MDRLENEILRIERAMLWGRDIMDSPDFEICAEEEIRLGIYALLKLKEKVYEGVYFLTKGRAKENSFRFRYEKNTKTGRAKVELADERSGRKMMLEYDGKQGFAIYEESLPMP